jgi:ketosteroid isomerase-like protein
MDGGIAHEQIDVFACCVWVGRQFHQIERRSSMERHPNEKLLRECYARLAIGDLKGMIAMCDDSMVFKSHGATPISGTFDNDTISDHIAEVMHHCSGSLKQAPVDIVANDYQAMALINNYLEIKGVALELRTIHIWKICDGKFISWEEYPGSDAEFIRAWS